MVEQTWTLAADMICKALFDRDMPFNPHFVFKCVKTYTDVMNHKAIRLKKVAGEEFEMTEEDAAKAMEVWAERAAGRLRRRSARGARAHAAEDDRGGRRRSDHAGVRPAAGDRRAQAVPVGRHRDDGADARLGALRDGAAPRGRRAHPQGRRAGLRRPRADGGRLFGARLHARRHPGDDAALSADLGADPRRHRSRRDRRQGDPPRRPRRAVRLRRASQRRSSGRSPEEFRPERWMGDAAKKR